MPIINISGGTEVGACFLTPYPVEEIKVCSLGGASHGMDVDVFDPDGQPGARRGRRAGLQAALARDDARHLGRPRALHGDLLVDVPGRLAPRRLGADRRRRRLVPARALRRHDQRGRQAARARRRSSPCSSRTPPWRSRRSWACPTRPRARRSGASAWSPTGRATRRPRSCASWWRASSAARSSRRASCSWRRLPKTRSAKILRRAVRAVAVGDDPGDMSSRREPAGARRHPRRARLRPTGRRRAAVARRPRLRRSGAPGARPCPSPARQPQGRRSPGCRRGDGSARSGRGRSGR